MRPSRTPSLGQDSASSNPWRAILCSALWLAITASSSLPAKSSEGQEPATTISAKPFGELLLLEEEANLLRRDLDQQLGNGECPQSQACLDLIRKVQDLRGRTHAFENRIGADARRANTALVPGSARLLGRLYNLERGGRRGVLPPSLGPAALQETTKGATGLIRGQVTSSATAEPLESTRINLYDTAGFWRANTRSGPGGFYSIGGLSPGSYFALAQSDEHVDELYPNLVCPFPCEVTQGTSIAIDGLVDGIDFALDTGATILGNFTDAFTGESISGSVDLYDVEGNWLDSAITDSEGAYALRGLVGGVYLLEAFNFHPGFYLRQLYDTIPCYFPCDPTIGTPLIVQSAETREVDFALEPSAGIGGAVHDATLDRPAVNVIVQAYLQNGTAAASVWVNSSGEYQLRQLRPGTYFVKTESTQFGTYINQVYDGLTGVEVTEGAPVEVRAGEVTQGIDFSLERLGMILGSVTDAGTSIPLRGLELVLTDEEGQLLETTYSDQLGYYGFASVPPGVYHVNASGNGEYQAEAYLNTICPAAGCPVAAGTPVRVAGNNVVVRGIDFALDKVGASPRPMPLAEGACRLGVEPAATLLFPYFEVDSTSPEGMNTLLSINNSDDESHVAQVTLWTDYGVPTLSFSVYLTGLDVQTLNLREIFAAGRLPTTGTNISHQGSYSADNASFPGCTDSSTSGTTPAFPDPALPGPVLGHLQAWHAGLESPLTGTCAASPKEGRWTGFVTADVVSRCSDANPSDPDYFIDGGQGIANNENVLFGDVFWITPEEDFAQGEAALHLRADTSTFGPGNYTFYGRHVNGDGSDDRQPLGQTYGLRYLNGGPFTGGTDLVVWRDSKSAESGEVACGSQPSWAPLALSPILAFDEEETFESIEEDGPPIFPTMTQRVPVGGEALPVSADYGWMEIDLSHEATPLFGDRAQGHVLGILSALGRFSVGYPAAIIESVCDRPASATRVSPATP